MEEVTAELPILALILVEEVPADDHRLRFRVIDIGGDDGAAACDLAAHELRRHERRKGCTEALPVGETRFRLIGLTLPPDILAVGDIDHLLGDDPGAGELELGDELLNLPLVAVYPLPP